MIPACVEAERCWQEHERAKKSTKNNDKSSEGDFQIKQTDVLISGDVSMLDQNISEG